MNWAKMILMNGLFFGLVYFVYNLPISLGANYVILIVVLVGVFAVIFNIKSIMESFD